MVDIAELRQLVEQDLPPTLQEIADVYGVSRQRISAVLLKSGIKKPRAVGKKQRQAIAERQRIREQNEICPECGGVKSEEAPRCKNCYWKSQRGDTKWVADNGYVRLANWARRNGETYEHRIVASDMLGRPLEKGEVVLHLNGKRDDNRPENLLVTTRSEVLARAYRELKNVQRQHGT